MLDTYEAIKSVLEGGGRTKMKHLYGVDTFKYGWVESYLRDKTIRQEIEKLEKEKWELEKLPIHKDELKRYFEGLLNSIREARKTSIQGLLIDAQKRALSLEDFHVAIQSRTFSPLALLVFSQKEIDAFFSVLPDGVREKEIQSLVKQKEAQIFELKARIEKELSPQERWFYSDAGIAQRYPSGCRWTLFVNDWKKVASRFIGIVNIEGTLPEREEEKTAYYALGIDKMKKLTSLREPHKETHHIYGLGPDYADSVKIEPLRD